MGYDMSFTRTPEGEDERVAQVRAEWEASVRARDNYVKLFGEHVKGSYTKEEFKASGFEEPPANSTDEYKRLQIEQNRLYELMYATRVSYFRLNIWGMQACRRIMAQFSMLTNEGQDTSDWPPAPEGFYDWRDARDYPSQGNEVSTWDAAQVAGFEAFEKMYDDRLAAGPEPAQGIPVWKLGSNDGWIVRPDEIEVALQRLDLVISGPGGAQIMEDALTLQGWDLAFWQSWVNWLILAMDHDGFRVY